MSAKAWNGQKDYARDIAIRKEQVVKDALEHIGELITSLNQMLEESLTFDSAIEEKDNAPYISLRSCNIADRPLLCHAWNDFRVADYDGYVGDNEPLDNIDYSKPVENVYYFMDIHYMFRSYDSKAGASIATAVFNDSTHKWILKPNDCKN